MKFTTHHASVIGLSVSSILCGMFTIITLVGVCMMLAYHGGIGHSGKYHDIKYQEYLIKNPGTQLFINNKQATPYYKLEFNEPLVLKLVTPGGQKYEAFMDGPREELIGNKLLAYVGGG